MPNNKTNVVANFKPDVEISIKHSTSTGQTVIASANGVPINPLFLVSILMGICKGNIDAMLNAQLQAVKSQPHKFLVLPGEVKCRHPYCVAPEDDPIHIKEAVQ